MRSLLEEPQISVERPSFRAPRGRPRVPRVRVTRRRVVVGACTAGVLLAAAIWLLFFSPVLALGQVVVEGVKAIPPAEVVQLAQVRSGEPLAGIDTGAIANRIQGMPTVARVSVWQRWPDTLVIELVERDRVAAAKTESGFDVMDETGYVFEGKKRRPQGVPLLDAPDPAGRLAALVVLHGLPEDIADKVESARAPNAEEVVLRLGDGVVVVWGGVEQSDVKAQVLRALLRQVSGDEWIDLRVPANPSTAKSSPIPAPPPLTETPQPEASPESSPSGLAASGSPVATPVPTLVPTASARIT